MAKNMQRYIDTLSQRAIQLHQKGHYEQALKVVEKTCSLANQHFGEEHPISLLCLNNLAMVQYARSNSEQAEATLQRILTLQHIVLEEKHPDKAVTLNNLASIYIEQDHYIQAEPLLLEAIAIWQSIPDGPHSSLASYLNNLARLYDHQDQFDKAIALYQQAIDIWHLLPEEKHLIANSLDSLGLCFLKKGESTKAIEHLQAALEMRRTLYGEQHPDVAENLNELGLLLMERGNYQQAASLYLQALDIYQTLSCTHLDSLKVLNNLATAYSHQGKYTEAERIYQKILESRRMLPDGEENHSDQAETLNNLASLHQARGNYITAEQFFQQALTVCQAHFGTEHPQTATNLDCLAGLYRAMGNYTQARVYYHQALEIRQKCLGLKHPDVGISLNSLALFYYDMDDTVKAEQLFTEALELAQQNKGNSHPDVASALGNLATIFYEQGKYAQAKPLFEESLTLYKKILGEKHPSTALGMSRLALLYHAMGDTTQAEHLLRQALEIRKQTLGELSPAYATNLQNLAWFYASTNRPQEAFALKKQAIVIEDIIMGQVFSLTSESQRQAHLEILNRFADSFFSLVFSSLLHSQEALQQALELALRRKSIGIEALTVQQDAILSGRYPELAPKLHELATIRMQIAQYSLDGSPEQDFALYQQQLDEWQQQREQLETDLARIPEMQLVQALAKIDRQSLCNRLPKDSVLIEFVRYEEFDFQKLPHQQRLLWKPARYAAFVLHANEPDYIQGIDFGEALPLAQQVNTFRELIREQNASLTMAQTQQAGQFPEQATLHQEQEETGQRWLKLDTSRLQHTQTNLQAGTALRISLFDPLLPALKGKTRLFIAPAGILHWLPFEVLPDDNGTYLIDRYQISYLGTGRDLVRQTMPHTFPSSTSCVIADPDFDLQLSAEALQKSEHRLEEHQSQNLRLEVKPFARLKGTRKEGEQVAKLLGVAPLLGEHAVETVLKACHSPLVLHIATHGFFLSDQLTQNDASERDVSSLELAKTATLSDDENGFSVNKLARFIKTRIDNPLLHSGLAFAGVNTWNRGETPPPEAEDGIFTAEDVSALDLRGTRLVVLSACETGLGREIHGGEGMPGLRRAFALAGAKTLVTSLWKVPDHHTQELMSEFYQRVLSGQGCADALREAQLALKTRYHHPYFWGAFICQGNPDPLFDTVNPAP